MSSHCQKILSNSFFVPELQEEYEIRIQNILYRYERGFIQDHVVGRLELAVENHL